MINSIRVFLVLSITMIIACKQEVGQLNTDNKSNQKTSSTPSTTIPTNTKSDKDNPNAAIRDNNVKTNQPATKNNRRETDNKTFTTMKIDKMVWDFGQLKEGGAVETKFEITNTGKNPLVIQTVQGSCNCITPIWTKKPIEPGQKSYIKVQFNGNGKKGKQDRSVNILANTMPGTTSLKVIGNVIPR